MSWVLSASCVRGALMMLKHFRLSAGTCLTGALGSTLPLLIKPSQVMSGQFLTQGGHSYDENIYCPLPRLKRI